MKKIVFVLFLSLVVFSCDKKSKIEQAVEEIPLQMKVHRVEQAFFDAKPAELDKIKAQYPEFFPVETPDEVWIEKMQNPLWRELYQEVEKKYSNFNPKLEEIETLFKHIKYYFPTVKTPEIYTVIGDMDCTTKTIYSKDKLIIALEVYLGSKHRFYSDQPQYIAQNFEERQMLPDVASSFAIGVIPFQNDGTLLSQMIYNGKELYLKDVLLADAYTDAEKIGYTPEQIKWSQENEAFIWEYFVEKQLLYSTNSKLPSQFITMAPFSKFYLEIDNESPGRIGCWIGWQIVRSYMQNNEKTTLQELIKMDPKQIFENSKYKPKRNE
jgi:gliding motility-associated lipoprotein GldB